MRCLRCLGGARRSAEHAPCLRLFRCPLPLPSVCPSPLAVFPNVPVPEGQTRAAGYSDCAMEGLAVRPRKGDAGEAQQAAARLAGWLSRCCMPCHSGMPAGGSERWHLALQPKRRSSLDHTSPARPATCRSALLLAAHGRRAGPRQPARQLPHPGQHPEMGGDEMVRGLECRLFALPPALPCEHRAAGSPARCLPHLTLPCVLPPTPEGITSHTLPWVARRPSREC